MPEVVVTTYPQTSCTAIAGGVSVVRTVTFADTIKTLVAKTFKNEAFKVFPNPVAKGNTLSIVFKEPGNYEV